MGSSESKEKSQPEVEEASIAIDPLINRLRSTFRLKISKKEINRTHSFIHSSFSQQILKSNIQKINPAYSPFCCIFNKTSTNGDILTCALISPIMALAEAHNLSDPTSFIFATKIVIEGVINFKKIKIKVRKTISLKDNSLLLFILDKPVWELGWCGISYLQSSERINDLSLYLISNQKGNPEEKNEDVIIIEQKLSKVFVTDEGDFKGKSVRREKGLLFQIIERKPYIVGVHSETAASFFSIEAIKGLQEVVERQLTSSKERDYLKEIDLQQMQIQTDW